MANKTTYQVQLTHVTEDGREILLSPKNDVLDVHVGTLTNGELKVPGSDPNEQLSVSMRNIRKYLGNLQNVASALREVSQSSKDTSDVNIPSTAVTAGLQEDIDNILEEIKKIKENAAGLAPIMHADTTTKYGGATGTKYGHVKTSDVYGTAEANADAANSVAASQHALYNAWNDLNSKKAPNNHAVNSGTYGKGSSTLYGHVKTSDTYDSTSTDTAEVATRKALHAAYAALKGVNDSQQTAINGKAPTAHASSAKTYGVGSTGNFGHLKISDSFNSDNSGSGAAAHAVAASSWAVYRAYSTLSGVVNGKLANSHKDEKATASAFSHVKLTDTYTSSQGAASSGIAPSSLALYNAYAALSSSITSLQNSVNTLNSKTYVTTSGHGVEISWEDNRKLVARVDGTGTPGELADKSWVNANFSNAKSALLGGWFGWLLGIPSTYSFSQVGEVMDILARVAHHCVIVDMPDLCGKINFLINHTNGYWGAGFSKVYYGFVGASLVIQESMQFGGWRRQPPRFTMFSDGYNISGDNYDSAIKNFSDLKTTSSFQVGGVIEEANTPLFKKNNWRYNGTTSDKCIKYPNDYTTSNGVLRYVMDINDASGPAALIGYMGYSPTGTYEYRYGFFLLAIRQP